jgi:hypothetical protein
LITIFLALPNAIDESVVFIAWLEMELV